MRDLDKLTKDELHGILTAYEMRIEDKPSKREAAFKASRKGKNKAYEPSDTSSNETDEEKAHFMRKLKKGSRKYQGNLPFKCFNCGRISHFASKCPQGKSESSDDEEDHYMNKGRRYQEKKGYKQGQHEKKKKDFRKYKRSLYSRKDNGSSEESGEEISNSDRE